MGKPSSSGGVSKNTTAEKQNEIRRMRKAAQRRGLGAVKKSTAGFTMKAISEDKKAAREELKAQAALRREEESHDRENKRLDDAAERYFQYWLGEVRTGDAFQIKRTTCPVDIFNRAINKVREYLVTARQYTLVKHTDDLYAIIRAQNNVKIKASETEAA